MSTTISKFSFSFAVCLSILTFFSGVSAQPKIEVKIKVNHVRAPLVLVEGRFSAESALNSNRNWTFTNPSGAENSGERISNLSLTGKNGQIVSVKKFAPGEYLADADASSWKYNVEIKQPPNPTATARISRLSENEQGILMLDDLLPHFSGDDNQPVSASVKFDLPADWKIITGEELTAENVFAVENVEKAIFLIGKNWREKEIYVGEDKLIFALSGDWRFSDDEAGETAARIFSEYKKSFNTASSKKILISLARFPAEIKPGRWQAETRGANVTILSSDMPFKTLSLQRLHEQLRHELFHLWIPNNLALTGNYDWFYEGFTIYQALKTGVSMNRIRFEDFLDTLAEAYNIDRFQIGKVSLIEAAKRRRSGDNPQAYARGMIVAFLCDAALLRESRGKQSIRNVFQQIYRKHRLPNVPQSGSAAVLSVLREYDELDRIIKNYVESAADIDWKNDLAAAGIEQSEENSFVRLVVKPDPTRRQKDLLNDLGYNNWRKMSVKSK